jgi:hypothetical protein
MTQITDLKAKKIAPGGKPVADGTIPGLRLEPGAAKGQGKWILRFVSPVTKKRRDMGLGTYPEVGIADARIRGMAAFDIKGLFDNISHDAPVDRQRQGPHPRT